MGCVGSKPAHNEPPFTDFLAHLPANGPLSAKEYRERLATDSTKTVFLPKSGITLRYAFVSQRGYYPGSPDKPNQDSLCVHTHFGGDPEQAFFGVFDGHGEYGTQCSQFAKDKVPENLLNNKHFATSPEIAYHRCMVLTNNQLHRLPEVDDSMSGTTAITLLVRGKTVYVANVGDSRAVLAERQGDRLVAQDLSFDQTPYRRDECERVKRCGARVLTLDQLEGLKDPNVEYWGSEEDNDGDPPRLWAPNATYPGTAFTRSIGDSAAERIGVFAEPEVVTRTLGAHQPFMVIASDGVWEFLPSQSVIDMVSKFDDPQEACLSVVAESYRLWLAHETRTDDITMLVVQFQGIQDSPPHPMAPTPTGALLDYSSRPGGLGAAVRKLPTMRMAPIEAMPSGLGAAMMQSALSRHLPSPLVDPAISQALMPHVDLSVLGSAPSAAAAVAGSVPGVGPDPGSTGGLGFSPADVAQLDCALDSCFLFYHMTQKERLAVYKAMHKVPVQAGQLVIRQGDPGDHFYVVHTGVFDVYLQQAPNNLPELVYTYGSEAPDPPASPTSPTPPSPPPAPPAQASPPVPASFGELALLYSKPRAATVVARTPGVLWSLSREEFRSALQSAGACGRDVAGLVRELRKIGKLECLSGSQLEECVEAMDEVSFADGAHIITQGDEGQDFFMVLQGEVVCTKSAGPTDPPRELLRLRDGQYFGERALEGPSERTANVIAVGHVRLLRLRRTDFDRVMGRSLPAIQTAESGWHTQLAVQREVLSMKTATVLHLQGHLSLEDLVARGLLFATDCSALMLMEHRATEEIFTVRVTSVGDVAAAGKQALVMRARDITRSLQPSVFVPSVMAHFKDDRILAEVLQTVGLCTLDALLADGPLDELSAMFVTASVVLGLEHLHWSHIMYRGLSIHSIIVTEGGQVQLVDFRFARRDDARAYTLCGNPEYLAPEVVQQRGHTGAADLWALGVLLHCLLTGETPFAQPGDDELRIYRRICGCSAARSSAGGAGHGTADGDGGTGSTGAGGGAAGGGGEEEPLSLSPALPPGATSLLRALLRRDPHQRLGAGPAGFNDLKSHPWFAPIDWDALLEHRYPPPPGIRERIYNFEGVAYAHFEPQPYDGDTRWCDNF